MGVACQAGRVPSCSNPGQNGAHPVCRHVAVIEQRDELADRFTISEMNVHDVGCLPRASCQSTDMYSSSRPGITGMDWQRWQPHIRNRVYRRVFSRWARICSLNRRMRSVDA